MGKGDTAVSSGQTIPSGAGPASSGAQARRPAWWRITARFESFLEKWGSQPSDASFTDEYLESVQANLWAVSPERSWYMTRRPKVFLAVGAGVILLVLAAVVGQPPSTDTERWWALVLVAVAVLVLGYATFPYWAARRAFLERRRKTAAYRAEIALRGLTESDTIPFSKLFSYNRKQLDAYQEESRNQQRAAFRQAQLASVVGLVILAAGIVVSLGQAPGSSQYVVAGLAGLGAALSAYISNTFARSARQADQQLNLYYREPHMIGRVMVTEHLAQGLSEDRRNEQLTAMITTMLGWPLPGDEPAPPTETTS